MKKRIFATFIILMLTMSLLSGCGQTKNISESVEQTGREIALADMSEQTPGITDTEKKAAIYENTEEVDDNEKDETATDSESAVDKDDKESSVNTEDYNIEDNTADNSDEQYESDGQDRQESEEDTSYSYDTSIPDTEISQDNNTSIDNNETSDAESVKTDAEVSNNNSAADSKQEDEMPNPDEHPGMLVIPTGGDVCPYETLKWTYYQGHFGFFYGDKEPMREIADMSTALYYPHGGESQSIMIAYYKDKGNVIFLYNDEKSESTIIMP